MFDFSLVSSGQNNVKKVLLPLRFVGSQKSLETHNKPKNFLKTPLKLCSKLLKKKFTTNNDNSNNHTGIFDR